MKRTKKDRATLEIVNSNYYLKRIILNNIFFKLKLINIIKTLHCA